MLMMRHIPIISVNPMAPPAPIVSGAVAVDRNDLLVDTRQRPLRDLRISVTDRCNFRCTYCMPKSVFGSQYPFLPQTALLRFEEITQLARVFIALGVQKIRITGGEPLLRKHVEKLISLLAELTTPQGHPVELTLTTNGSLLPQKAKQLKQAGLTRLTVSLDGLDDVTFRTMNDAEFPVADVLRGIDAAQAAGFEQIKINTVIKRGVNDQEILPLVRHFKGSGHILRFIEFMDVGSTNGWRLEHVVPSHEVLARIQEHFALETLQPNYSGEVAQRWRHVDGSGEIGVISSVTQAFCRTCSRARLSTDGKFFTCLFATHGIDLTTPLRHATEGAESAELEHLQQLIQNAWQQRADRYSELRSANTSIHNKVEMSYIGG